MKSLAPTALGKLSKTQEENGNGRSRKLPFFLLRVLGRRGRGGWRSLEMLQKFALAFKTKTIEFFAEEEEEEEENQRVGVDLDTAEEVITGQRVVVIKPDNPSNANGAKKPPAASAAPLSAQQLQQLRHGLVSSLFAAVSSFHAAYLNLQVAHEPLNADGIVAADRAAVSHLQRLSDLRRGYHHLQKEPIAAAANGLALSSHLEAQVQENQSRLRKFETVFNRLQADIDRKAQAKHIYHMCPGCTMQK